MSDLMELVTHELQLRRVGATVTSSLEYRPFQHEFSKHLAHSLSAYMLTEKLCDDTHTERAQVPAPWWQHWKQARGHKLTRWIPRRFPPKMRTLEVTVRWERHATRPYADYVVPSGIGSVVYQECKEPRAVWND